MTHHKFRQTDLEVLENNPPKGKFHLLVVGTFNGNIPDNLATWFYGRRLNKFWYLLPKMLGDDSLHSIDKTDNIETLTAIWKDYCATNRIIIVDIFKGISKQLTNHSDSEFWNLKSNEYEAFDFKKAFADTQFDAVLFTWKGMDKNLLTEIKKQYTQFFEQKGAAIMHMLTPSNAYRKPRELKLEQWKIQYDKLKFDKAEHSL